MDSDYASPFLHNNYTTQRYIDVSFNVRIMCITTLFTININTTFPYCLGTYTRYDGFLVEKKELVFKDLKDAIEPDM